jgi:hypothetical protein
LISAAVRAMPRLRPARRNAAAIRLIESVAAMAGVGAIARTARASGLAIPSVNRLAKGARKLG